MKGKKEWRAAVQETAEAEEKAFAALIAGQYKEMFEQKVEEAVKERLAALGKRLQAKRQQAMEAQQQAAKAAAQERYGKWQQEAKGLLGEFPALELEAELANPLFLRLLESGVGVRHAYQAVHFDELMDGLMRYTAQKARQAALDGIKANGIRPEENGVQGSHGAVQKVDVKKLTAADRRRLAEEARRHPEKRISFM